ncbi:Facilitated trehalose transporter Tret1 [Orchesella cincta]|uniref:Facilitated trehalose transporter Tret1 n=1 Tax=Orchesella cincta TaxID=48709 RepID=A0A1D2MS84_ORCCI|nr:Facilitated trehalose transporter Tret1 [Orchesella cincta]
MALFATGNILGFSSVSIPSLLSKDSEIEADAEDMSWMASLITIGCIVGTLVGGLTSDAIGRKRTILLSSLMYTIGWVIISQSTMLADLLTGRMLTGIASGFYSVTVQVYVCEIADPEIRGVSGSLPTFMVSLGILIVWCLGSVVHWRTVAMVCGAFPMFVFFYVLFLPESPVWLISRGQQPEALKNLTWLKNDPEEAQQECMRLQYLKERRIAQKSVSITNSCTRFCDPSVIKRLLMGVTLFFVQQFCGQYCIVFYATMIFRYADHFINDYLETIALGFVRMFATLIALFLINFMKQRTLLIISGLLMSLSTGLLGSYFLLREFEGDFGNSTFSNPQIPLALEAINIEWVPLACLITFMSGYSIGWGIIPWFLIPGIMPSDVRSFACSITFGLNQLFLFTSVKTFLTMVELLDAHGVFWFYSGVALFGTLFVILYVPETSNLDSAEIEEIFQPKPSYNTFEEERQETDF